MDLQKLLLQKKVEQLEQEKAGLEKLVADLRHENKALQKAINDLQDSSHVQPTHRNILYSEQKKKKRLVVFTDPVRGADEAGSLVFGECFAVRDQKENGDDLWLQIHGGDHADQWVLGCDAGTVNCVDMTKYDPKRYPHRIESGEYRGQVFPKQMYTEGCPGSSSNDVCLISASRDSLWREVNIEMLFRGIATATVFEEAWGGDDTFTDWVAYYAVNCVQYGQLRTPWQKHLLVTVKPTIRWPDFQAGCCCGPDLDQLRDDIGKAQCKECFWLKGMKEQLHVKWEEVEFLTGFAFLRTYCAWTDDDCKRAANARFLWVLREFFAEVKGGKAAYELERAHWLWDEAFDGCQFEEAARAKVYVELSALAGVEGARLDIPASLGTAGAAPLAWGELAAAAAAAAAAALRFEEAARERMDGVGRLSAGNACSVALDPAGRLHAWGAAEREAVPTLAPGARWVAVSAGGRHTLGLTAEGALLAWGHNSRREFFAVPALRERWAAVSAGGEHSLGLTSTGKLHAWGCGWNGTADNQCDIPKLPDNVLWAAASAGWRHSLGITDQGTVYAWGSNRWGQCAVPELPQGERWVAVSAGAVHSLGLTAGGQLHAWGSTGHGQCDVPLLAPGERWVAVSAGAEHSMGLTSAGALHAWGRNSDGRCNVPAGELWLAVSAGNSHSLGLTSAGLVRAWGRDEEGQVSQNPWNSAGLT